MITILTSLCITVIVNSSNLPWDNYDQITLERAKNRCSFYFPKSPCLKQLEKKGYRRYWATCGK